MVIQSGVHCRFLKEAAFLRYEFWIVLASQWHTGLIWTRCVAKLCPMDDESCVELEFGGAVSGSGPELAEHMDDRQHKSTRVSWSTRVYHFLCVLQYTDHLHCVADTRRPEH